MNTRYEGCELCLAPLRTPRGLSSLRGTLFSCSLISIGRQYLSYLFQSTMVSVEDLKGKMDCDFTSAPHPKAMVLASRNIAAVLFPRRLPLKVLRQSPAFVAIRNLVLYPIFVSTSALRNQALKPIKNLPIECLHLGRQIAFVLPRIYKHRLATRISQI
jgi:hypothetical protein